jgi:hypothetical protein
LEKGVIFKVNGKSLEKIKYALNFLQERFAIYNALYKKFGNPNWWPQYRLIL